VSWLIKTTIGSPLMEKHWIFGPTAQNSAKRIFPYSQYSREQW